MNQGEGPDSPQRHSGGNARCHALARVEARKRILPTSWELPRKNALEFGRAGKVDLASAIVVPSGGHPYALIVDEVEDVVEAEAAPRPVGAPLGPGWDRIASGMVEANGELLLCVDPHLLIAGPAAQAA